EGVRVRGSSRRRRGPPGALLTPGSVPKPSASPRRVIEGISGTSGTAGKHAAARSYPQAASRLAVSTSQANFNALLRQLSLGQLAVPLVHQGPVDRAGAEVGHVQIALEPGDRGVEQAVVLAEDRTVAGQQPFDVAGA